MPLGYNHLTRAITVVPFIVGAFLSLAGSMAIYGTAHSQIAGLDPAGEAFASRLETLRKTSRTADGHLDAWAFCSALINAHFDVPQMAAAASAGASVRMSPQQNSLYLQVFLRRITRECADKAAPSLQGEVRLMSARRANGSQLYVVTARSTDQQEPPRILRWELAHASSGGWKVIDVYPYGRSAVLSARTEAEAALSRSGGEPASVIEAFGR